ncbi:heparanase-like [Aricia agestis]|uniref:heparanase-like n=1 Tax=Aricia agestis TaxID=91739 RepID=UPI001C20373B|nr:heparanase-like [Aricia agestis]
MLSNRRLVLTCAIFLCCNTALLVFFVKFNIGERCYITINKDESIPAVLPENFLSIGIDTSQVQHHNTLDFSNKRFGELAAALAPARVRLGGTLSDLLIFSADENPPLPCQHYVHTSNDSAHPPLECFYLTGSKWTQINEFCKATNLKLLFTFNVLMRNEHGWNSHNALEILKYSHEKKYDIDWQLGNEPNSFHHVFNVTITPQVLAHDFKKLRKLLNTNGYKKSLLVGPDTTRPQEHQPNCLKYMVEFLGNGSHSISVRSWHQYYLNSRTATLEEFWNPKTFDLLKEQIETMQSHTKDYNNIPMWLTETSTSYGGGAPGLSNTYAGSPLWVDKLGLAARYNITSVFRQSFYGGNYSMIDHDFEPLPDWWISVLYKKLVGSKVLNLTCKCSQYQRMYAHCANTKYTSDPTAITIYAVNLQLEKAKFLLNGTAFKSNNLDIDEYIISAPSNNRKTKTILLNGWPLQYESSVPNFKPNHIKYGNHISMPPYSIGFWVIKNTSVENCK